MFECRKESMTTTTTSSSSGHTLLPALKHISVSHNAAINDKCVTQYLQPLLKANTNIITLSVEGCPKISTAKRKQLSDMLRYNNSFLKTMGFSTEFSLAILESVDMIETMTKGGGGSSNTTNNATTNKGEGGGGGSSGTTGGGGSGSPSR
mmetsp:Transcript_4845/g.8611  ORF Transcript_4845/g.8611 Transcript_4845/m.8611 type:complete len:150 (+) Transcript_4845:453-902(+)